MTTEAFLTELSGNFRVLVARMQDLIDGVDALPNAHTVVTALLLSSAIEPANPCVDVKTIENAAELAQRIIEITEYGPTKGQLERSTEEGGRFDG